MIKTIFHPPYGKNIENIKLDMLKTYIIDKFDDFCSMGSGTASIDFFIDDELISNMIIAPNEDYGIYLYFTNEKFGKELFSLYDKNLLNEVVEVADEIYISKGLFLPIELAWLVIKQYVLDGTLSEKIDWGTADIIPEDGGC